MPHAIADSDDDGDDLDLMLDDNAEAKGAPGSKPLNMEGALEGTNEKSTGSTGIN